MKISTGCGFGQVRWHVHIEPPAPDGLLLRLLPRRLVAPSQRSATPQPSYGLSSPMLSNGQMLLPGVAEPHQWEFGRVG
jgi:hypothetical protein